MHSFDESIWELKMHMSWWGDRKWMQEGDVKGIGGWYVEDITCPPLDYDCSSWPDLRPHVVLQTPYLLNNRRKHYSSNAANAKADQFAEKSPHSTPPLLKFSPERRKFFLIGKGVALVTYSYWWRPHSANRKTDCKTNLYPQNKYEGKFLMYHWNWRCTWLTSIALSKFKMN